jgi:hypothetical protein
MSRQLASSFFKGVLNLKSPCVSLLIFFSLQKLRDTVEKKGYTLKTYNLRRQCIMRSNEAMTVHSTDF